MQIREWILLRINCDPICEWIFSLILFSCILYIDILWWMRCSIFLALFWFYYIYWLWYIDIWARSIPPWYIMFGRGLFRLGLWCLGVVHSALVCDIWARPIPPWYVIFGRGPFRHSLWYLWTRCIPSWF